MKSKDWETIATELFSNEEVKDVRIIVEKFDGSSFETRLSKPVKNMENIENGN